MSEMATINLELGLLVLESVLLVATLILLIVSLKEGRHRDELIKEVGRATKVMTRMEYFLTVTDTMLDAEREVLGRITGRRPSGDDLKRTEEIMGIIERLAKSGVAVKYLLPKFQDRLYMGLLYKKAGAEIRYTACKPEYDLRYTVVDSQVTIVGLPEEVGEKEATKKGYLLPSEGLSGILANDFHECWDGSATLDEYIKETMKQTGASSQTLAKELGIDQGELEGFTS
jgi:hypothetical protein